MHLRVAGSEWIYLGSACLIGLLAGLAFAAFPLSAGLIISVLLVIAVWTWPTAAVTGAIAVTALFQGLFLHYRVDFVGAPASLPDALPWILLLAGIALHSKGSAARLPTPTQPGLIALGLLGAGLIVGATTGILNSAPPYQFGRVLRVEAGLLVALTAGLFFGFEPAWRRAARNGLLLAGVLAAGQFLVNYFWTLTFGQTFWSLFPFGYSVDLGASITGDNINLLRTNAVSTYLLLPLLVVASVRTGVIHRVGLALAGSAILVSLSRGFWAASVLAVILILIYLVFRLRRPLFKTLAWAFVLAATAMTVVSVTGGVLQTRFDQILTLTDASSYYRQQETAEAWAQLSASPLSLLSGTGAGVIISHRNLNANSSLDQTSNLENSVLSRWTNFGLFSLLGTILLISGSVVRGWRSRARDNFDADLAAMTICLPVLFIGGLVGGTLLSLQGTMSFWILAGTILSARPVSS